MKRAGDGIKPENVVAFTFTDKAAAELKDRITRMYRDEFGNVEGLAGLYVGTIHGFCLEVLQQYLFRYLKYDVTVQVPASISLDKSVRVGYLMVDGSAQPPPWRSEAGGGGSPSTSSEVLWRRTGATTGSSAA